MRMMDLTDQWLELYNMIDELEDDSMDDAILDTLEGIEGEIEQKADKVAHMIRLFEADAEAEKFKEFIDEYTGTTAEIKKRMYEETIRWTEAICRISNTCGVSYNITKDIVIQLIEEFKKPYVSIAKWVIAGTGIDCLGHRFKEYKCSKCGNIDLSHRKNKFCPECGRRMEG